jgi:hypothetical protein
MSGRREKPKLFDMLEAEFSSWPRRIASWGYNFWKSFSWDGKKKQNEKWRWWGKGCQEMVSETEDKLVHDIAQKIRTCASSSAAWCEPTCAPAGSPCSLVNSCVLSAAQRYSIH